MITLERLPGTERVYNIEIEGQHVYYVTGIGILAHNSCGVRINYRRLLENYGRDALGRVRPGDTMQVGNSLFATHAHHIVMKSGPTQSGPKLTNRKQSYENLE